MSPARLAVRALILVERRLLLVNAYPGIRSDLWCAPGGGVEPHRSLPENLVREVHEETGLTIEVGGPVLVNEFHRPDGDYHQVEVFFRARIASGRLDPGWRDPEGVVDRHRLVTRDELTELRHRPATLAEAAWGKRSGAIYDPLEPMVG